MYHKRGYELKDSLHQMGNKRLYYCKECKIYYRSVPPFKIIRFSNYHAIPKFNYSGIVACPNCRSKKYVENLDYRISKKMKKEHPNILLIRRKI